MPTTTIIELAETIYEVILPTFARFGLSQTSFVSTLNLRLDLNSARLNDFSLKSLTIHLLASQFYFYFQLSTKIVDQIAIIKL